MRNTILHITNGDSAVDIMKETGIEGDFLPWLDVLHVGPVPEGLSFQSLSQVRADFIKEKDWGLDGEIQQSFDARLEVMSSLQRYEKIILWFEHDLYDQLQLIEILAYIGDESLSLENISLVCTEHYLGLLTPEEMKGLYAYESSVTQAQIDLASKAWRAFRASTPKMWQALLKAGTSVLPFLEGEILRMLEEYPSKKNGLSRTAQKVLEIVAKGVEKQPGKIFGLYAKTEERIFLGDTIFWEILAQMLESNPPLLTLKDDMPLLPICPEQVMKITDVGREVLSGKKCWTEIHRPNHWIGGVHLTADNIWFWDGTESVRQNV